MENVFKALGWLLESGTRANAQGAAYMRNAVPDMPQVTSASGVVYTELPSATQVIEKVARDLVPTVLTKALGDPVSKQAVQTVLETTAQVVKEAEQRPGLAESIQRDILYGLSRPFEMGSTVFNVGKAFYNRGQLGTGRAYVHDLVHTGF